MKWKLGVCGDGRKNVEMEKGRGVLSHRYLPLPPCLCIGAKLEFKPSVPKFQIVKKVSKNRLIRIPQQCNLEFECRRMKQQVVLGLPLSKTQ